MIHPPVGWALGSPDFKLLYSGVPIGTALGRFWPAFDRVGQAGREPLLFRVASNTLWMRSPFPQVASKRAPFKDLKQPVEAPMQEKPGQGM